MAGISFRGSRCPFLLLVSIVAALAWAVCVEAFMPASRLPSERAAFARRHKGTSKGFGQLRKLSICHSSTVRNTFSPSPGVSMPYESAPSSKSFQVQQHDSPSLGSSRANSDTSSSRPKRNPHVFTEAEPNIPLESLLPTSAFEHLPWSRSITGEGAEALLYMPFVHEQIRHISSLDGYVKEIPIPQNLAYHRAERKAAHMGSFCVETPDFRKIRFTYMDAGKNVQVFNSVWYPRLDSDAPILGMDLLLFGGQRMLAVMDFQPLSQENWYKEEYIEQLKEIRAKYPALCESIGNRYYEDRRWFSDNILFGRFTERSQVQDVLLPAFIEYMQTYTTTVRHSRRHGRPPVDQAWVKSRQEDYDCYNLVRDPAGKLFTAYFGDAFSREMLGFLFEWADVSVLDTVQAAAVAAAGVKMPVVGAVVGQSGAPAMKIVQ